MTNDAALLILGEIHRQEDRTQTRSLSQYIKTLCQTDRQRDSYQNDNGNRTSKAPDEFVIDGDPTKVWVSITLGVQAHRQACSRETTESDLPSLSERQHGGDDREGAVRVQDRTDPT